MIAQVYHASDYPPLRPRHLGPRLSCISRPVERPIGEIHDRLPTRRERDRYDIPCVIVIRVRKHEPPTGPAVRGFPHPTVIEVASSPSPSPEQHAAWSFHLIPRHCTHIPIRIAIIGEPGPTCAVVGGTVQPSS